MSHLWFRTVRVVNSHLIIFPVPHDKDDTIATNAEMAVTQANSLCRSYDRFRKIEVVDLQLL